MNEGRVSSRYEKTRAEILSAFQNTGLEFTITGLAEHIPCAKIYITFAIHHMLSAGDIERAGDVCGCAIYRPRSR